MYSFRNRLETSNNIIIHDIYLSQLLLQYGMTYSRIKCEIYTYSKKNLRKYFILFVCCYLAGTILIEICTL